MSLLGELPQAALIVEAGGEVMFANRAALAVFGLALGVSADPLTGPLHLPSGVVGDRLRQVALPAAAREGSWQGVVRLPDDGPLGSADASVRVVRVPGGRDAGRRGDAYAVTATVVPVAQQAEDRARLLAAVVDQSTEFIAWHGPLGAEARINPAAAAMVGGGVRADTPLTGRVRDLFEEDSRRRIDDVGSPAMYETGAWRGPVQIRNQDTGEVRDLDWAQFVVRRPDGALLGTAGMGRDVTEQRRADAARRAAQQEAEVANRAKTEFISHMSHELRTPLTAILGFGQLLDDSRLDDDQRESVTRITSAGEHLLTLINDLLDMSAVESGHLRLSLEPVDLADVAREAMAIVSPLAVSEGIAVLDSIGRRRELVLADRQRLKQIVLNLLSNAVKYNRPAGEVRIGCDDGDGGRLRLTISDTGLGIGDADLQRLFMPFERFGAKQSSVGGTGLGLAVSKGLAEAMGATIGARSRLGAGSHFWIELGPVAADGLHAASLSTTSGDGTNGPPPVGAEEPAPDTTSPGPLGPTERRGDRIVLYIDDNPVNVQLVTRILQRRPEVTLLTALSGTSGLELARRHRPALVLLDLNLPDLPGREVLARLRADADTAGIPVVIVSGDAHPSSIEAMKLLGAGDYLTKPYQVGELLALVDRSVEAPDR